MKKMIYIFIFIVITVELWGKPFNMMLEYKYVSDFKIIEDKDENNHILTITGLCMHSNYVVKEIKVDTDKNKIKVLIRISIFKKKNETGRFKYELRIPENIKQIVFGNEEIEIWKRTD